MSGEFRTGDTSIPLQEHSYSRLRREDLADAAYISFPEHPSIQAFVYRTSPLSSQEQELQPSVASRYGIVGLSIVFTGGCRGGFSPVDVLSLLAPVAGVQDET